MKKIFAVLISMLLITSLLCIGAFADYGEEFIENEAEFDKEDEYYESDSDSSVSDRIIISVAVGFVIALITVLAMRSKMKTVRSVNNASNYVVPGSFDLRVISDRFLYMRVVRTKRNTSQNNR